MNSAFLAEEMHAVENEVTVKLSIPSPAAIKRTLNRQRRKIGQIEKGMALNWSDKNFEVPQK